MQIAAYENAKFLLEKIQESDAVLVGAAAGFSAADGHHFWYEADDVFRKHFAPFIEKYGIRNAFDGFYYPYKTSEERWAFLATLIDLLYHLPAGSVYKNLKKLLEGKSYHIMSTNQDFLFAQDFDESQFSAIQGDWRYFQPTDGSDAIFDNKEMVERMLASIPEGGTAIASETIPRDPNTGRELMPWIRHPGFLEKTKYNYEYTKIQRFLEAYKNKKILFLELGVGRMTPMFIQEPFWNLTYALPFAYYISINPNDALLPEALLGKGMAIHEDIRTIFQEAVDLKEMEKEDREKDAHKDRHTEEQHPGKDEERHD